MSAGEVLGYVFLAVGIALTFTAWARAMRELEEAESRAERLEEALRGLLYCLNAGYPCTAEMDIARAALAEVGE